MPSLEAGPELQKQLRAIATQVDRAAGEVLFRRGDAVQGAFLVLEGAVWMGLDEEHRRYPERLLGPGCVLGLPATLSGEPYSLTAKAQEKARLGFVPRGAVLRLLSSDSSLSLEVLRVLSEEISEMRALFDRGRPILR
jgi:CRP-like cAMP-binding protein